MYNMLYHIPFTNPAIASSATQICKGSTVTFTTNPINSGATPKYTWLLNGQTTGGNTAEYSNNNLEDNDEINVRMNSNAACVDTPAVSGNSITIRVNETVNPVLEIFGDTLLKTGESVSITAKLTNAAG